MLLDYPREKYNEGVTRRSSVWGGLTENVKESNEGQMSVGWMVLFFRCGAAR